MIQYVVELRITKIITKENGRVEKAEKLCDVSGEYDSGKRKAIELALDEVERKSEVK